MHKVVARQSVTMYARMAAEESVVIRCLKTKRDFCMRVILYWDDKKESYTNPQGDYSYCPYCGAKIDQWKVQ